MRRALSFGLSKMIEVSRERQREYRGQIVSLLTYSTQPHPSFYFVMSYTHARRKGGSERGGRMNNIWATSTREMKRQERKERERYQSKSNILIPTASQEG